MFPIKICGITCRNDFLQAIALGADAVGINFFWGSRRYVSPDEAASWLREASDCTRVGVFVNSAPDQILRLAEKLDLDVIQLHGDEPWEWIGQLRPWPVIRAIRRMPGQRLLDLLAPLAWDTIPENLAAILIDTAVTGSYGGTGQPGSWHDLGPPPTPMQGLPWMLAGGLTPENVVQAICQARPTGVDVASGVEASVGRKDFQKMKQFIARARQAFQQLASGTVT